jgi:hypothetical protein
VWWSVVIDVDVGDERAAVAHPPSAAPGPAIL